MNLSLKEEVEAVQVRPDLALSETTNWTIFLEEGSRLERVYAGYDGMHVLLKLFYNHHQRANPYDWIVYYPRCNTYRVISDKEMKEVKL